MRLPLPSFNTNTIQVYWQIQLGSISVNGADISLTSKDTIFDSGTPFITADNVTIANIYNNIAGSTPIPNSNQWTSTRVASLLLE